MDSSWNMNIIRDLTPLPKTALIATSTQICLEDIHIHVQANLSSDRWFSVWKELKNFSSLNESFQNVFLPDNIKKLILRYKSVLKLWISEQRSVEWLHLSKIFMAKDIYNQTVLFNYQQKLHTLTFTNTKIDLLITVFYKTINIWIPAK